MIKMIIERADEYENVKKANKAESSCIGLLKIFDEKQKNIFTCFTLENGGESTSKSGLDKKILAGEYYLRWTSSSTNGALAKNYDYWKKEKHMGKITDGTKGNNIAVWIMSNTIKDHNKRRILMHVGNYPQDTLGCILCGYTNNNNGTIGNSTKCINDLFLTFEKYGIENFKLEIKDKQ